MAGVKTGGKLPCMIARGEGNLNTGEAAKRIGVKSRYLSMATWRPGGKRNRQSKGGG